MVDFLEKRKSKIHGQGIFTTTAIPKGKIFYKVPMDVVYDKPRPRCTHIGDGKFVSDEAVLNYVNHSCEPNTLLDCESEPPSLISIRDIEPGEELTVDYNRTETDGEKVSCTCGSEKCRGYFLSIK